MWDYSFFKPASSLGAVKVTLLNVIKHYCADPHPCLLTAETIQKPQEQQNKTEKTEIHVSWINNTEWLYLWVSVSKPSKNRR